MNFDSVNWRNVAECPVAEIRHTMLVLGARGKENQEYLERMKQGFPEFFEASDQSFPITWEQLRFAGWETSDADGTIQDLKALEYWGIPISEFGVDRLGRRVPEIPEEWEALLRSHGDFFFALMHDEFVVLPATATIPECVVIWYFEETPRDHGDPRHLLVVSNNHLVE